jgi:hypothetical protein
MPSCRLFRPSLDAGATKQRTTSVHDSSGTVPAMLTDFTPGVEATTCRPTSTSA